MAQPAAQAGLNVPPGGNPPAFTVRDAMLSCGVTQQQADTLADQVFMDSYESCMDLSDDDLKEAFKTLSNLTVAEGRIRLLPAVKNRIKAFHQWAKDQFRMGLDPSTTAFPGLNLVRNKEKYLLWFGHYMVSNLLVQHLDLSWRKS